MVQDDFYKYQIAKGDSFRKGIAVRGWFAELFVFLFEVLE